MSVGCPGRLVFGLLTVLAPLTAAPPARAETLLSALAQAYRNNPQLNAERARVRATDENVPQALSGYRPTVAVTADVGVQSLRQETIQGTISGVTAPRGYGVTASQNLFNGFRTGNRTRAAEGQVFAAREGLRILEQQVLLDAVTQYENVLRDTALVELNRRNVETLEEQVRQTRERFRAGDVTQTDVAQAETRLASARISLPGAEANLLASKAAYRRVIGAEPVRLGPGTPVDNLSPRTLKAALDQGNSEHPQITAAMYAVDVQLLQVKIAEGALYPTVTLQANVQQRAGSTPIIQRQTSASAVAQISIPLYQGGQEYSLIRQSKETLGQQRLDLERQRDLVRAAIVTAWSDLEARKVQIRAAQAQISAAELALSGVREEARVGQRTTLDVLNAQQEVVAARAALANARRDRVVASYTLLASTGRLGPRVLNMPVDNSDPSIHYHQVRDAWTGVRTPDGR